MRDRAKQDVNNRLLKIEGQVRGLRFMIESGRESVDVLTQLAAARAALESLGTVVIAEHMDECLTLARQQAPLTDEDYERKTESVRRALSRLLR